MTAKDKFYSIYMDFFEIAKRKRRWKLFDDVPWNDLSPATNTEERAIRIETYCAEEMYLPDYTAASNELLRGVSDSRGPRTRGATGVAPRTGLPRIPDPLRPAPQAQFDKFDTDGLRSWKVPFKTRRLDE